MAGERGEEVPAEFGARAGEAGLGGFGGGREIFRERADVGTGEIFRFEKCAIVGVELSEGGVECGQEFVFAVMSASRGRGVGGISVAALEELPEAAAFAPTVVERGAGDDAQPGGEYSLDVAGACVTGDAEIGLLKGFGSECVIAARGGEELAEDARAEVAVNWLQAASSPRASAVVSARNAVGSDDSGEASGNTEDVRTFVRAAVTFSRARWVVGCWWERRERWRAERIFRPGRFRGQRDDVRPRH